MYFCYLLYKVEPSFVSMRVDDFTELNPASCFVLEFQIAYWEVFDGSVIRELDGSLSGAINGMDITVEGVHFVTGQS